MAPKHTAHANTRAARTTNNVEAKGTSTTRIGTILYENKSNPNETPDQP
jgi:hypothetical protein